MSRWTIEKSGTGIEKSGTGIEKSGTGIEKSGTGIEKSGTGIEKSGTGIIRRGLMACSLAALTCAGSVQAGNVDPAGSLQIVVNENTVAVSWIIGDSVFSGVSSLDGSFANLMLTEVALSSPTHGLDVTGGGTGSSTQVTGGGTGSSTQVTGGGTGSSTQVTGGGTGSSTQVTGGGTGSSTQVTGGGTGSTILVTGGGTGSEAITITLPNGTGMSMEVIMGCGSAGVTIVDEYSVPVVSFSDVRVFGDTGNCGSATAGGFGAAFLADPGRDFRSEQRIGIRTPRN